MNLPLAYKVKLKQDCICPKQKYSDDSQTYFPKQIK